MRARPVCVPFDVPRGQERADHSVEAVRELVRERAAEARDRAGARRSRSACLNPRRPSRWR